VDCTEWKPQIEKAVATCGRRLPAEQREDLRQDCYLALIEKAGKVDAIVASQGRDSGGKYVYRIAMNRCITVLRKNRRRDEVFPVVGREEQGLDTGWGGFGWSDRNVSGDPGGFDRDEGDMDEQPINGELSRIAHFGVSDEMLDEAISRLDPDEQHVIRELFFEGNSERVAGRQVGHSQRWTRTRKRRALENLKAALTEKR